jgi:tetratricopeptide (TPR) repeat protein
MPRFRIVAWFLALVTVAVYLPVRTAGFVYDDFDYIVNNPAVRNGLSWAGIQWAFTTSHSALWHPLTWISLMLDCQLFGLNPGAMHVVNVFFHSANAVLLLLLLFRLTGDLWPSAFVAALFAWHPLRVESVAWIVERKDMLSTFFELLALLAYTRHAKARMNGGTKAQSPRDYLLALFFFGLALMCKPMPVTLPFVLLLLDLWPLQRFSLSNFQLPVFGRLLREKWPFFVLSVASCLVTLLVQHHDEATQIVERASLAVRLENAPVAYALYLLKMIWPANLAIAYPLPDIIPQTQLVVSLVVLAGISIAVWRRRKGSPFLLVGWLWFLGTLVPVLGVVQAGSRALADRYSYFPLIGVSFAIAFGLRDVAKRLQLPKNALAVGAVAIFAGCIFVTEKQLPYWQNNKSLFLHALEVAPDNPAAHLWVGMAYQDEHNYPDALIHFREAERLAPDSLFAHFTLGGLLADLGRPADALVEYQLALQLRPGNSAVQDHMGLVLITLGRYDEAIAAFKDAARSNPTDPWPHFYLAKLLAAQGRDAAAIPEFREAIRLDPDNPQTLAYAAELLAASKDPDARNGPTALDYALRAVGLTDNSQPFALDALGMAYAETGRFDEAQKTAQAAIDLATGANAGQLDALRERLARYQNHQPWRQSFQSNSRAPKAEN